MTSQLRGSTGLIEGMADSLLTFGGGEKNEKEKPHMA